MSAIENPFLNQNVVTEESNDPSLREFVREVVDKYFNHLDGASPSNVYQLFHVEFEAALLGAVMKFTNRNQSRASEILGINRGTLRKKLKQHQLES